MVKKNLSKQNIENVEIGSDDQVKIWESKITLPTYEIGPEDPNPVFFGTAWVYGRVYPYTKQDVITRIKKDKDYIALYLQNKYLRILVLPELGSRIYAFTDKTTGKEIFYRQHVVKPALIGLRGAWVSGGNELNFPTYPPNEHSATCFSPVNYALRKNPDGSSSIILENIDKILRMECIIVLTLYPDVAYLEQEAILYNRTDVPNIYVWWANAAVPATADLKYEYPARTAYPERGKIVNYPIHQGMDFRRDRNADQTVSIFMRQVRRDFFGVYYSDSDFGVVHTADWHEVPGKKIFSWGNGDDGKRWIKILTDKDGQYVEIQAGRYWAEWDYYFMEPRKVDHVYEYWYPIKNMGDFVFANRDLAVNLERLPVGQKMVSLIKIAINATSNISHADIQLIVKDHQIYKKTVDLSPELPFSDAFSLKTPMASDIPWVLIVSHQGKELIRYDTSEPIDGNYNFTPIDEADPTEAMKNKSAEKLTLEGVFLERNAKIMEAQASYQKALKIDPGYSQALMRLGILCYKAGKYGEAHDYLHHAFLRSPDEVEIHYYLGLSLVALGQLDAAEDHFWVGLRRGLRSSANSFALGQLALLKSQFRNASKFFHKVLSYNPLDFRAAGLLALSLRKQSKYSEARQLLKEKLFSNPLDYLLNSELYFLGTETSNREDVNLAQSTLDRLFKWDVQNCLEVQSEYGSIGFLEEANQLLKYYVNDVPDPKCIYPLVYYYLSYYNVLLSNDEEARKYSSLAAKMSNAYVFPSRTETIKVLEQALKLNSDDGRAHYYLGNLLFSKYRYEEGIKEWQLSTELEDFAVARRNLGLVYWQIKGDLKLAVKEYERAIKLNPLDFRYYCDLNDLYLQVGEINKAFQLLKNTPKKVRESDRVLQRLAVLHILRDEYNAAISILNENEFHVREGEVEIHNINLDAHLEKGWELYKSGNYSQALEHYQLALTYPKNQNIGKPKAVNEAKINYLIGLTYQNKGKNSEAMKYWKIAATEKGCVRTYLQVLTGADAPPYCEASCYKAMALKALGKMDEAQDLLNGIESFTAGASSKNVQILSNTHLLKGLVLKEKGKFKEAKREFEAGLKLVPSNLDCHFALKTIFC